MAFPYKSPDLGVLRYYYYNMVFGGLRPLTFRKYILREKRAHKQSVLLNRIMIGYPCPGVYPLFYSTYSKYTIHNYSVQHMNMGNRMYFGKKLRRKEGLHESLR